MGWRTVTPLLSTETLSSPVSHGSHAHLSRITPTEFGSGRTGRGLGGVRFSAQSETESQACSASAVSIASAESTCCTTSIEAPRIPASSADRDLAMVR